MKIRNSQGRIVNVRPQHEAAVKRHIANGNHKGVDDIINSYPKDDNDTDPAQQQNDPNQLPNMAMGGRTFNGGGAMGAKAFSKTYSSAGQGDKSLQQDTPSQQDQTQQILPMVLQALQQGQDPRAVVQMLIKQGVPQQQAEMVVQQALSQLQSQNEQTQQDPKLLQEENGKGGNQNQQPDGAMKMGGKIRMKKYQQGGMQQDQQVQQPDPSQQPQQGDPNQQQGGDQQQQMQQLMQMVMQALQQGQQPQQVMQMLVQKGVPQQVAQQVVQMAMQQMQGQQGGDQGQQQAPDQGQGQPQMKYGGIRIKKAQLGAPITDQYNQREDNRDASDQFGVPNVDAGQQSSQLSTLPNPMNEQQLATPSKFNPALTSSVVDYTGGKPQLNANEQNQYGNYLKTQRPYVPTNGYGNSHFSNAAYDLNSATMNNKLKDSTTDPKLQHQYGVRAAGNTLAGAGNLELGIFDTAKEVAGAIGSEKSYRIGKMNEQEAQLREKRANLMDTNPYNLHGDNSALGGGRNNPLSAQYGAGMKNMPNVVTERNEVINDTNNVYKDGGDLHSDPSGGNYKNLKPGSVIHSASIGMKIGDLMSLMTPEACYGMKMMQDGGSIDEQSQQPEDQSTLYNYAAQKLNEKFKDPNKVVSFAQIANVFNTDDEDKKLGILGKKILKNSTRAGNPTETSIGKKTGELNTNILADEHNKVSQERALKLAITGPEGPFHNIAENLKSSGAYGDKIMKDSKANAKYGKKISLPKFGLGGAKDYVAGLNLPHIYAQSGAVIDDPFTGENMVEDAASKMLKITGNTHWDSPTTHTSYNNGQEDFVDQIPSRQMNFSTGENVPGFTSSQVTQTTPVTPSTGISFKYNQPASSGTYGTITPTGQNILTYPGATQYGWDTEKDNVNKWLQSTKTPTPGVTPEEIKKFGYQTPEQIQNGIAQKAYYTMKMSTPEGQRDLANVWENLGLTHQGQKLGLKLTPGELLSIKDPKQLQAKLTELQDAYTDGMPVARKLDSRQQSVPLQFNKQTTDDTVGKIQGTDISGVKERNSNYYNEGLNPNQYIGELSTLFDRYEPAPFVVSQGNKQAYAQGVRPENVDIQPELNRNLRSASAATRYRQNTPESQAFLAQLKTNEMLQNDSAEGRKHNADAQNYNNFVAHQQGLISAAGQDQATGLRQGAIDTAKGHSAFTDRRINAESLLGNKFQQNQTENRASDLYQDMFNKYGINPMTWGTDFNTDNTKLSVGNKFASAKDRDSAYLAEQRALKARYYGAEAEAKDRGKDPEEKKFGGKVKSKLPKKRVK